MLALWVWKQKTENEMGKLCFYLSKCLENKVFVSVMTGFQERNFREYLFRTGHDVVDGVCCPADENSYVFDIR